MHTKLKEKICRAAYAQASHRAAQAGFSLLELSMALLIIAMIAGFSLTSGSSRTGFARVKQTQDKLLLIEEALAAYVSLNGKLPCPAPGATTRMQGGSANTSFGRGDCNSTRIARGTDETPDFMFGMLPVKDLHLADQFAFDGWDRRFSYAVDARFTSEAGFAQTANGFLQIVDSSLPPRSRTERAVVVFYSHGLNGYGAWPKEGGKRLTQTPKLDASEAENVHTPTAPSSMDEVFAQGPMRAGFDDYLLYTTKLALLRRAGSKITDHLSLIREGGKDTPVELRDSCRNARLTLQPYRDICLLKNDEPRTGPVGCETDSSKKATPPCEVPEKRELRSHCVSREVFLAQEILSRCFYK